LYYVFLPLTMEEDQASDEADFTSTKEMTEAFFQSIVDKMRDPIDGVSIKDRRYHLQKNPKCFIGTEGVAWLVTHGFAEDANLAVSLGQMMMDADLLHHVKDAHNFKNEELFYRFNEDDTDAKRGPSVASLKKSEVISRAGKLKKKGILFWSERYAVLDKQKKHLYFFESELSTSPKSLINLNNTDLIGADCECKKGEYCWTVREGKKRKKHSICASSTSEQEEWLSALAEVGVKFAEENSTSAQMSADSIYDFEALDIDGNNVSLSKYKGKVCIITNVATY